MPFRAPSPTSVIPTILRRASSQAVVKVEIIRTFHSNRVGIDAMDNSIADEYARKRVRLSSPTPNDDCTVFAENATTGAAAVAAGDISGSGNSSISAAPSLTQAEREAKVGITKYVSPLVGGFAGVFKKRYTDFLINEVLPTGEVLHLKNGVDGVKKPSVTDGNAGDESMVDRRDDGDKNVEKNIIKVEAQEESTAGKKSQNQKGSNEANGEEKGNEKSVAKEISEEDRNLLLEMFDDKLISLTVSLWNNVIDKPKRRTRDFKTITSKSIDDKETRTKAHQLVRRIFNSTLETRTADDNSIVISAAPKSGGGGSSWQSNPDRRRRGKQTWSELGGEYLHFTLYKENKDTMEVIVYLSSKLKLSPKHFQFAGTKDRRGVAVQRVSAYRVEKEKLISVGKTLRNAQIGDFEYQPTGLELGQLDGNKFAIALRDCHFHTKTEVADNPATSLVELAHSSVKPAVAALQEHGFINYYGLQRFGSFSTGTDIIGLKLLQGDLEGAINKILSFSPAAFAEAQNPQSSAMVSHEDKARAIALHTWATTHDAKTALQKLPRRFSAEANLIRHLGFVDRKSGSVQNRKADFQGALSVIPRNLRLMYVHAYQSLVWNVCAGERWRRFGSRVVKGDLVLVHEHREKEEEATTVNKFTTVINTQADNTSEQPEDEVILPPTSEDRAASSDDAFVRARSLTQQEADSGRYTIFDVVLPQPGFDVLYPDNDIGEFYVKFMASERGGGLDPHNMRRGWKEISLSGGYRKLLGRPLPGMDFEIKRYQMDDEQLWRTDVDIIGDKSGGGEETEKEGEGEGGKSDGIRDTVMNDEGLGDKIAVILKLQLKTSQYATMALRELMKNEIITYQPDFGGGR